MQKDKSSDREVEEKTFSVMEEEIQVGKRTVETGTARVSIQVNESAQVIEQPLIKEEIEIQRVEVNRFIDRPVETRTEGDLTVIPVMEEVLVVEKKLRLKEELHIRRRSETVTHRQNEKVRKEEVMIEHTDLPE